MTIFKVGDIVSLIWILWQWNNREKKNEPLTITLLDPKYQFTFECKHGETFFEYPLSQWLRETDIHSAD